MAILNVRIEAQLKHAADRIFESLGFDTESALRIFLHAAVREQGMPFAFSLDEHLCVDLIHALEEIESGRVLYGPFKSGEETVKSMLKD